MLILTVESSVQFLNDPELNVIVPGSAKLMAVVDTFPDVIFNSSICEFRKHHFQN